MDAKSIEMRLVAAFPEAKITLKDLTGGGDHWDLTMVAKEFQGKSLVEQHQLVYRALGEWMKEEIHALALHTKAAD